MTPEQKLRKEIVILQRKHKGIEFSSEITEEHVDGLWTALRKKDLHWDTMNEFRYGQVETNIECDSDRNYETKSVAAQMSDGSWVGWTVYYGGGKHGEPETFPWMENAYDLLCQEREQTITVRTFALLPERSN